MAAVRRHPFFALLDNATVRQLGIGACVALGIVGVYAAVQHFTAESPSPPSEWLTAADEQQLREGIEVLGGGETGAWVAGCAWEHGARFPGEVLDLPANDAENYEAETSSGRALSFAVISGSGASGTLESVSAPGYYCLVPAATSDAQT